MRHVIAVMVLLSSATAEAAFYKCVVGGKTVFSDQPCAADAKRLQIREYVEDTQAEWKSILNKTKKYVRMVLGKPDRVEFRTQTQPNGIVSDEQWIYELVLNGRKAYRTVAFTNGMSVSHTINYKESLPYRLRENVTP